MSEKGQYSRSCLFIFAFIVIMNFHSQKPWINELVDNIKYCLCKSLKKTKMAFPVKSIVFNKTTTSLRTFQRVHFKIDMFSVLDEKCQRWVAFSCLTFLWIKSLSTDKYFGGIHSSLGVSTFWAILRKVRLSSLIYIIDTQVKAGMWILSSKRRAIYVLWFPRQSC